MRKSNNPMILAIETSCDETAAAVTRGTEILSSVKFTQQVHAQWGGVVPALAKRDHEVRIEGIVEAALRQAQCGSADIAAVAVTAGPGLAIALEVGIAHAKAWAEKLNKPLIAVNHIEGHILSALIKTSPPPPLLNSGEGRNFVKFPALGLVISGGHTQLILVEEIGKYKILVESLDDNIGEALDKGARMLGLPYPGGPLLEKAAAVGDPKKYKLPLPMAGKEGKAFSYSGLKTAFLRLTKEVGVTDENKSDLAACYQEMVFRHLIRTVRMNVQSTMYNVQDLLVGGGVIANKTLRIKLDELGKELGLTIHYPENMMLCTDNAAMIGVAAGYKYQRGEFTPIDQVDRRPRWRVGGDDLKVDR